MHILLDGNKLQQFCDIIGNLKFLCDVITFNFSDEGLYSQGMTFDHCGIFELKMGCHWFHDYEWEAGVDSGEISVSSEFLSKILSTRQPSQHLVIEYFGKPDHITIKLQSTKAHGKNKEFPKEFCLSLIDVDHEKLVIPPMEYSAEFGIDSKALQTTNDQLSLFNETLTIHCSEDEIYLRSKGTEGQLKVTLFNENCEHITEYAIEEELNLTLDFSIKHFNSFCRFIKVSNNICLSFKKDVPMKFEYITEVEGEEKEKDEKLNLVFYLAPKISDEDEE